MNWGGPNFVLLIIALSTGGWLINNWIRARHGYALEDEFFGKTEKTDPAAARRHEEANAKLLERIAQLEKRTAALEVIVTDSSYDTARQIEALTALDIERDTNRTAQPRAR